MNSSKKHLLVASVLTLAAWGVASFAVPAVADDSLSPDSASPDEVSVLVSEAATSAGVPPVASTDSPFDVSVPADANDGIVVETPDGRDFTVAAPNGVPLDDGVAASDGSTVFDGEGEAPDVTVTPLDNGVRVSTVLWDEASSALFEYPLPEGVDAEMQPDGSVTLMRTLDVAGDGNAADVVAIVGRVEPAWAVDADGEDVPTSYVISEGTLTQRIDTTDAAFPVVADPTWGFTSAIQVRVRWSRAETASIAAGGWGPGSITAICASAGGAVAGPAGAAAFGAGCLATSGPAVYTAGVAQSSKPKRCLEGYLTYVPGVNVVVPWYGTYACR